MVNDTVATTVPVQELVEYPIAVMEMVEPVTGSEGVEEATHMVDNAPETPPTKASTNANAVEKEFPTLQTPNGI